MDERLIAAIIFLGVYLFLASSTRYRGIAAWLGVSFYLLFGIIPLKSVPVIINWNVMGIFIGTLIITVLFIYSKVPAFLADYLVNRSRNVGLAALLVCILSSGISAFVENVATVLIVAPIALEIARKLRTSPVPFVVGIAICSNLQGAATLIGDPPSMILAGFAGLNFNDFFFLDGKPSIFFSIQLGAIASFFILWLFFRKYREAVVPIGRTPVETWFPTVILVLMVMGLALSSFVKIQFAYLAGGICMVSAFIGLAWQVVRDRNRAAALLKEFDWDTSALLAGIFVLVGGLQNSGCIAFVAQKVMQMGANNSFNIYSILVWLSVFVSAFVDNVPYVTAMIPVGQTLAASLSVTPYLFLFGILIGACIGGNITPIGAAANIVGVGLLKKNGYPCSFWSFVKIGLPFSLVAVGVAYWFTWLVW